MDDFLFLTFQFVTQCLYVAIIKCTDSKLTIIIFYKASTSSFSVLFAKYNLLTTLTHQGPQEFSVPVINLSFDVLYQEYLLRSTNNPSNLLCSFIQSHSKLYLKQIGQALKLLNTEIFILMKGIQSHFLCNNPRYSSRYLFVISIFHINGIEINLHFQQ